MAVPSVSRVLAAAAAVAAVLVTVAGCAGNRLPYATPGTSAPAARAASPSAPSSPAPAAPVPTAPVAPAAGQLTGTQLRQVLLPQPYFPAGFALAASSVVTSGEGLSSSPARYALATVSCADFVSHLGNTGFGETAMAADSFVRQSQAIDQVVYQFGSAAAASSFVAGIKALAGRCHSFTVTDNGASGTLSLRASRAAPVAGHPSLELLQTGTIGRSSVTLDTLFTASGVDVFAAAAVGLGTAVPGVAKETIVTSLMERQSAEKVLS